MAAECATVRPSLSAQSQPVKVGRQIPALGCQMCYGSPIIISPVPAVEFGRQIPVFGRRMRYRPAAVVGDVPTVKTNRQMTVFCSGMCRSPAFTACPVLSAKIVIFFEFSHKNRLTEEYVLSVSMKFAFFRGQRKRNSI